MRHITWILLVASLLGCSAQPSVGEQGQQPYRIIVVDRDEPAYLARSPVATVRWLTVEPTSGETTELFALETCVSCGIPALGPDGRGLWVVTAAVTGGSAPMPVWANKMVRVDGMTGVKEEGPVFSESGLGWAWRVLGFTPDGREAILPIPHNPIHASENPLHTQHGTVLYNLAEGLLDEKPFFDETVESFISQSADGRHLYLCCWVQGNYHPVPGVTVIDAQTGESVGEVALLGTPGSQVHTTKLTPAPDGRHFYALRAGTDLIWKLDAVERKVVQEGRVAGGFADGWLARLFPTAYAKMGPYNAAAGALAVSEDGELLASSLYLVEQSATEPGPPTHLEGGGIVLIRTRDFKRLAHLEPGVTFESVALSPDGRFVYALDTEGRALWVFDTQKRTVVRKIEALGQTPERLIIVRER